MSHSVSLTPLEGQAREDGSGDENGVPAEGPGEGAEAEAVRGGALRASSRDEGSFGETAAGA